MSLEKHSSVLSNLTSKKYFPFILFVFFFFLCFLVYLPTFLSGNMFLSADAIQYFSPRILFADFLKSGQFSLWNPFWSNGGPWAGDQYGVFYPIQILLSLLPAKLYAYFYYYCHWALGATFMYLYLKEIGCTKVSAFSTSTIYLFSIHLMGYRKSHVLNISSIIFFPLILFFIERYGKSGKLKFLVGSALIMALQFFSGHMQITLYADMAIFVYLIAIQIKKRFSFKKILGNLTVWASLYIGLIAIQLLPLLQIIKEYQTSGATETSYGTFTSYSIFPGKLIMMLFPHFWGADIYQPLGSNMSSELDIELFLGVSVFILAIFAMIFLHKHFLVKVSLVFMAISFVYASQGHIPFLSKLLFSIPVINGFRVSSRALFIFIFFAYVLFALTLSELREIKNFMKTKRFYFIFSIGILALSLIIGCVLFYLKSKEMVPYVEYWSVFSKFIFPLALSLLAGILILFVASIIYKKMNAPLWSRIYPWIALGLVFLTLWETIPYAIDSQELIPVSRLTGIATDAESKIQKTIGHNKIIFGLKSVQSEQQLAAMQPNINLKIPMINSYWTFNNPRLFQLFTDNALMPPYYNWSGLLAGFQQIQQNLELQNSTLSMLGVKYVVDPYDLVNQDGSTATIKGETELLREDSMSFQGQEDQNISVFWNQEVNILPNTYYRISFEVQAKEMVSIPIHLDFSGANYDNLLQERSFGLTKEIQSQDFLIYSGDTTKANASEINLRLFGISPVDFTITNLKLAQVNLTYKPGTYKLFATDGDTKIYENTTVKDIVYSSDYVKNIANMANFYSDIINNPSQYHFLDTSYIENYPDTDFSTAKSVVKVTEHKNNSIIAEVTANEDTFINFSQNYFPGWKAYIDGQETPIFLVNGSIQGIQVPAGNHQITFCFQPNILYIGMAISGVSLIAALLLMILPRKKTGLKATPKE